MMGGLIILISYLIRKLARKIKHRRRSDVESAYNPGG
jgi:hypothetical protein